MKLRERLKTETATLHDELEALPFFEALRAGTLPKPSMVSFLRSLAIIHAILERELSQTSNEQVFQLGMNTYTKVPLIMADIQALGGEAVPSVTSAIQMSLEYGNEMLTHAIDPFTLIGPAYVLEGSQNGGIILKKDMARCFQLHEEQVSYFGCYGSGNSAHWGSIEKLLNSMELGVDQTDKAVQSAVQCFQRLKMICSALHPYADGGLKHHVAAYNFEAGDHAMPQDPREVYLALRAGQAAWERYPYLGQRFGDRGKRFTQSDSCWLVALTQMSDEAVTMSLDWLRTVLASRGIPTVILANHLRAISQSLAAELGEKAERRTRFDPFLASLDTKREALRGAPHFSRLVRQFDQQFNECDGLKVDSAAELIVSAWIDEHSGLSGALPAIRDWFDDAGRFSAAWNATVGELVGELNEGELSPC